MKNMILGVFIGFFLGALCLWGGLRINEHRFIQGQIESSRKLATDSEGAFYSNYVDYRKAREGITPLSVMNENCDPNGALGMDYHGNATTIYCKKKISGQE